MFTRSDRFRQGSGDVLQQHAKDFKQPIRRIVSRRTATALFAVPHMFESVGQPENGKFSIYAAFALILDIHTRNCFLQSNKLTSTILIAAPPYIYCL